MLSRRMFLGEALASAGVFGGQSGWPWGVSADLRFGVISDIHVTTPASTAMFRRALAHFRAVGVDAVVVAGDLSDWGLLSGIRNVKTAWDAEMSGTGIIPLFVTGNHDFEGAWYGDMTLDMHMQGYSEREALVNLGMKASWESVFGEPYETIRMRTVRGFRFVSVEWPYRDRQQDAVVSDWLKAHADELSDGKPFFFVRHEPIPGAFACFATQGDRTLAKSLSAFPNCIALTGHTHWTFHDERAICQDAFTAVTVPSLSYTSIPKGYENGSGPRQANSLQGMRKLASREHLEQAQGYVVTVVGSDVSFERFDFAESCSTLPDWSFACPIASARPYSFGNVARRTARPQFPIGARLALRSVNSETRNGRWAIFMGLMFPSASATVGRAFDYEVRTELEDGTVAATKHFLSPAFYKSVTSEPESQDFLFAAMDLPDVGRYRLRVYPRNCFGACGEPISSDWLAGSPGKTKAVGSSLPRWKPGELDIHSVGAPGKRRMLVVLPDGTSFRVGTADEATDAYFRIFEPTAQPAAKTSDYPGLSVREKSLDKVISYGNFSLKIGELPIPVSRRTRCLVKVHEGGATYTVYGLSDDVRSIRIADCTSYASGK